ncbi:MAG: fumarylacetoacetate hydrolase family protein [Fimbriimonas sp.]
MRIVRFRDNTGVISFGEETPGGVVRLEGSPYTGLVSTGEIVAEYKLLAPVEPTQLVCIGLNYRFHAEETKAEIPRHPIVFFKNLNATQNPGDPIVLPRKLLSEKVDYECELAVVIGRDAKNVSRADALDYVLGYTAANDVSARDWQKNGGGMQWCRGKSFDTFAPLGPVLVTPDEIANPNDLAIRTILNGEVVQDWNTNDMIFDVPFLIEFLSASTTLPAGTVILTGTPQGVGMARTPQLWMKAGDTVTVSIEKIGDLTNPVVDEDWSGEVRRIDD